MATKAKKAPKEKKPTKAELKKEERRRCRFFVSKAYATALMMIPPMTMDSRKSVKINIAHMNCNRYIHFNIYCRSLSLLFYQDGNVEIVTTEFCHSDHREMLFTYTEDEAAQEKFLDQLRELLSWLIPEFVDEVDADFHTFMDYVDDKHTLQESYGLLVGCTEVKAKEEADNAVDHC